MLWPPRRSHLPYIFKRNNGAGNLKIMKKCRRRHRPYLLALSAAELISYYCRKHPCWILILFNDKADIILLWVPIESTESSIAAHVVPIESTESSIAVPVVPPTIVIRITLLVSLLELPLLVPLLELLLLV